MFKKLLLLCALSLSVGQLQASAPANDEKASALSAFVHHVKECTKTGVSVSSGAALGLLIKRCSFDAATNDSLFGPLLNAVFGILATKYSAKVIEKWFDEHRANMFCASAALCYVIGDSLPGSHAHELNATLSLNALKK